MSVLDDLRELIHALNDQKVTPDRRFRDLPPETEEKEESKEEEKPANRKNKKTGVAPGIPEEELAPLAPNPAMQVLVNAIPQRSDERLEEILMERLSGFMDRLGFLQKAVASYGGDISTDDKISRIAQILEQIKSPEEIKPITIQNLVINITGSSRPAATAESRGVSEGVPVGTPSETIPTATLDRTKKFRKIPEEEIPYAQEDVPEDPRDLLPFHSREMENLGLRRRQEKRPLEGQVVDFADFDEPKRASQPVLAGIPEEVRQEPQAINRHIPQDAVRNEALETYETEISTDDTPKAILDELQKISRILEEISRKPEQQQGAPEPTFVQPVSAESGSDEIATTPSTPSTALSRLGRPGATMDATSKPKPFSRRIF